MRNRAKCLVCKDIIESTHRHDFVSCRCGEIQVDGGEDYHRALAKDWANFRYLDDEGNEIPVKVKETDYTPLDVLREMRKKIEELPPVAMTTAINHYDYLSLLLLLEAFFASRKDES